MPIEPAKYRIGHGFDLHRLELMAPAARGEPARDLILAGVAIESDRGPISHSDGDVALHALTDALLGALGEPDIGEIFPDSSPKWRDADSSIFVREAVARMRATGYVVCNADITVILERPRLSPYKDRMRLQLANLLEVGVDRVNIKAKSHEKLDALGEGRGVAAHAVVLIERVVR